MKIEWRNIYLQTDEILAELEKDEVNIYKLIKLLREIFEDLVSETTATGLIEVDRTCLQITFRTDYWSKLREPLENFISECLTLDDYPSQFALSSPKEILDMINGVYIDLDISAMNIRTKRDEILELYNVGENIINISTKISEHPYYIERVLFKAGKIKGYSEKKSSQYF